MSNSKDYRVRLGKHARELATDHHGRLRAWNLERAIEELQNSPVQKGEEQLRILKEQLVEFNVQIKTANTFLSIIVSELAQEHTGTFKEIDWLLETLQLEAASRANLEVEKIGEIRGKKWSWYQPNSDARETQTT